MDKNHKGKNSSTEGELKMTAILKNEKLADLKCKLNLITKKATPLQGNKDMIELNPNNSQHKEWFEEDEYKGKK